MNPVALGRFVLGVNLAGSAVTMDGHAWRSDEEAHKQGLTTDEGGTANIELEPQPAADPATTHVLSSGIYGNALHLVQTVPNGRYAVRIWVFENWRTNHRSMDLAIGGDLVAKGIGSLEKAAWQVYGPFVTDVRDGRLSLALSNARADTAHMHVMGFDVHEA